MDNDVKSEILFHIEAELGQKVDAKQLLNMVRETVDGFELRAYGKHFKFNEDGDLL